jgi:hypothetical protein
VLHSGAACDTGESGNRIALRVTHGSFRTATKDENGPEIA